jgi:hypothetical protein
VAKKIPERDGEVNELAVSLIKGEVLGVPSSQELVRLGGEIFRRPDRDIPVLGV